MYGFKYSYTSLEKKVSIMSRHQADREMLFPRLFSSCFTYKLVRHFSISQRSAQEASLACCVSGKPPMVLLLLGLYSRGPLTLLHALGLRLKLRSAGIPGSFKSVCGMGTVLLKEAMVTLMKNLSFSSVAQSLWPCLKFLKGAGQWLPNRRHQPGCQCQQRAPSQSCPGPSH